MLARLILEEPEGREQVAARAVAQIAAEFPGVGVTLAPRGGAAAAEARLETRAWRAPDFDLGAFDARMNALSARGLFALGISGGDPDEVLRVAGEALTRCQRLAPRRNPASRGAGFDDVLARHRALHDLSKPLVRADYDHALDTWQWVLRLSAGAGLAVQVAALFHDVERLLTEADARVEHRAGDYQAFKDAHAAGGARLAARALEGAALPIEEKRRALALIAEHERREADPDQNLLNDADALSFFSLNSGGFIDYYGVDHTRKKIAYTLRRLGRSARRRLLQMRHPAAVMALLAPELS